MPGSMKGGACCVQGCEAGARHVRSFTVSAEGWGEIETEAAFCCEHIDMLASEVVPVVDIIVSGVERR